MHNNDVCDSTHVLILNKECGSIGSRCGRINHSFLPDGSAGSAGLSQGLIREDRVMTDFRFVGTILIKKPYLFSCRNLKNIECSERQDTSI